MQKGRNQKEDNQKDKFIQTAKEHGCDESEKVFSEKMKKLAAPEKDKK